MTIRRPHRARVMPVAIYGMVVLAGEMTSSQMARAYGITREHARQHLLRLVDSGFLTMESRGRETWYLPA